MYTQTKLKRLSVFFCLRVVVIVVFFFLRRQTIFWLIKFFYKISRGRVHVNAAKTSQKIERSVEERIKAHATNLFPIRKTQNPAVSEQMDEIGLLVSPAKLMQILPF